MISPAVKVLHDSSQKECVITKCWELNRGGEIKALKMGQKQADERMEMYASEQGI